MQSLEEPFKKPEIAGPTFGVLRRAEAMGLRTTVIGKLDLPAFLAVVRSLQKAGIAREAGPLTITDSAKNVDSGELLRLIGHITDALEESPAPEYEWRRLASLFQPDQDQLADLLGISASSLRRYASKQRETPDGVAGRLHFLALLTGDLAGAYNDIGVRAWFGRKRALLDGKAPKDLLRGEWRPGDPGPERVRALARGLAASPAT